jgi:hypothetical protein
MRAWLDIAREFGWKRILTAESYPCGTYRGWAIPVSLRYGEEQLEDGGCVCHTPLYRALLLWAEKLARNLVERAEGNLRTESALDCEAETERLSRLVECLRNEHERAKPPGHLSLVTKPAVLAGPIRWSSRVYRPDRGE